MVRLHLDVLEPVLAHLHGADLVAAALVSRDFLAAALPAIYAAIEYTPHHAKQALTVDSPFATLSAHHHLAMHVRRIAVHAAPLFHVSPHTPHPQFIDDLARAIRLATNLRAFVCTVHILPPLLRPLVEKHTLAHLRVAGNLGARQLAVLRNLSGLYSLALDAPSWHIIDALPHWSASMQRTLAHITLFMSQDLDAAMLNVVLAELPHLHGLHVINCPRITHAIVLKALERTPDLLELSFTLFPSQENTLPPLDFAIPPLTHLSIDIRASYPVLRSFVARILSRLSPRVALAICGGWLGEIRGAAESTETSSGSNDPSTSQNPPPPTNNQNDDLPLLSPPQIHNPNQPPHFSFSFGYFTDGHDHNGDDDPPEPPNPPDPVSDPNSNQLSLTASLPSTLTVLHLPLISPGALREVIERCEDLQVLGIVLGPGFASPHKSSKPGRARPKPTAAGIRSEVALLASILARARALRELILDTSNADIAGSDPARDVHDGFTYTALLTRTAVRTLMREVPLLRRIVGEGRVWESSTLTPTMPVPFPDAMPIDLTLSRMCLGPGVNNHHAHGPPGFGTPGGGYTQVEIGNDHWFWLSGSASGGKVYNRF